MTRDEIEIMEGRELDAAVAEFIMEWEVQYIEGGLLDGVYVWVTPAGKWVGLNLHEHYSTDIAAAWKVVEMMHSPEVRRHENGDWFCDPFSDDRDYDDWVIAPTAPLAICRAMLIANLKP